MYHTERFRNIKLVHKRSFKKNPLLHYFSLKTVFFSYFLQTNNVNEEKINSWSFKCVMSFLEKCHEFN